MDVLTTLDREKVFEGKVSHNRLRVFKQKGFKCVKCGIEGVTVKLTRKDEGSIHLDLYTKNNTLMTIDHIIPKSKGGQKHIDNLQPMCSKCNCEKGNKLEDVYKEGKM